FVKFGKLFPLIRLERHIRRFARLQRPLSKPAEAAAVVTQATESELRQFAIADDVDAGIDLFANDIRDSIPQPRVQLLTVNRAASHDISRHLDQIGRPIEPARMCGENPIRASLHENALYACLRY